MVTRTSGLARIRAPAPGPCAPGGRPDRQYIRWIRFEQAAQQPAGHILFMMLELDGVRVAGWCQAPRLPHTSQPSSQVQQINQSVLVAYDVVTCKIPRRSAGWCASLKEIARPPIPDTDNAALFGLA